MMMNTIKSNIEAFYESLEKGTSVCAFLEGFDQIIQQVHKAELIEPFRLGKDEKGVRLKKLRDEVSPVVRFVREHAQPNDTITFNLNNEYPDCTVRHQDGLERGIEVTVARGVARYHETTRLNNCGESRPLIGLQDNASKANIEAMVNQEPEMYSTEQAIDTVVRAIENSAEKKMNHEGHTLLIKLDDMELLPKDRWCYLPELFADNATATNLRFSEVYVTGKCDGDDLIRRIK